MAAGHGDAAPERKPRQRDRHAGLVGGQGHRHAGAGLLHAQPREYPYAWTDGMLGKTKDTLAIIDKRSLEVVRTLTPAPGKTAAHVEFDKTGRFALVSVWENDGALVIYDAATFAEIKRIPMSRPSGKYNVWNKITSRTERAIERPRPLRCSDRGAWRAWRWLGQRRRGESCRTARAARPRRYCVRIHQGYADNRASRQGSHDPRIIVYPLFFSDGYFTKVRLPQLLAEAGLPDAGSAVRILPPLGLDPGLAALLAANAARSAKHWMRRARNGVVLLAHGSTKDSASRRATDGLAEALRALNRFSAVSLCLPRRRALARGRHQAHAGSGGRGWPVRGPRAARCRGRARD
jgi:sirohydrochlorin ferrochelatase